MSPSYLPILAQDKGLTPIQRNVKAYFQEGGSGWTVLGVVIVVTLVVLLAWWLTRRRDRSVAKARSYHDPMQLYEDLLDRLELPSTHRRVLEVLAGTTRLEHPTVVLLSPTSFDRAIARWREAARREPRGVAPVDPQVVQQVRSFLFPET